MASSSPGATLADPIGRAGLAGAVVAVVEVVEVDGLVRVPEDEEGEEEDVGLLLLLQDEKAAVKAIKNEMVSKLCKGIHNFCILTLWQRLFQFHTKGSPKGWKSESREEFCKFLKVPAGILRKFFVDGRPGYANPVTLIALPSSLLPDDLRSLLEGRPLILPSYPYCQ